MNRMLLETFGVKRIEGIGPEVCIWCFLAQDVIHDDKDRVSEGNNRFVLPQSSHEAVILSRKVVAFRVRNRPCYVREDRTEGGITIGHSALQALAATLSIAWGKPGPRSTMLGGGKNAHIHTDLSKDHGSGRFLNARKTDQEGFFFFKRGEVSLDLSRSLLKLEVEEINRGKKMTQEDLVMRLNATQQCFLELRKLCAHTSDRKISQHVGISGSLQDGITQISSTYPSNVSGYGSQLNGGTFSRFLQAVDFVGSLLDEGGSVARKLTQKTNRLRRKKACLEETMP